MNKEILYPLAAAVLASTATWFIANSVDFTSIIQREKIATEIMGDDEFRRILARDITKNKELLEELKKDEKFRGAKGDSPLPKDVANILQENNEFIKKLKTVKFSVARTAPQHQDVPIEPRNKKLIDDFDNMIRYELNFDIPVDVIIPQLLAYDENWSLWKIDRDPKDKSGKKWIVSFQVKRSIVNAADESKAYARFIGISF